MKRTTVFIDESVLRALQQVAKEEGLTFSAATRKALEEFVGRRLVAGTLPSFLGIGRSGRKDVAERAEELLWTSPRRKQTG